MAISVTKGIQLVQIARQSPDLQTVGDTHSFIHNILTWLMEITRPMTKARSGRLLYNSLNALCRPNFRLSWFREIQRSILERKAFHSLTGTRSSSRLGRLKGSV
eukprot:COSAG02_NODE_1182_length_14021_cov_4.502442_1_plen_104_part_00